MGAPRLPIGIAYNQTVEFDEDEVMNRAARVRAAQAAHQGEYERELRDRWASGREFITKFARFLKKNGYAPVPVFNAGRYRPHLFTWGTLHFDRIGMGWVVNNSDWGPFPDHAILESGDIYQKATLQNASARALGFPAGSHFTPKGLPRSGRFITVHPSWNGKEQRPVASSPLSPGSPAPGDDLRTMERIVDELDKIALWIVNSAQDVPGNINAHVQR